MRRPTTARLEPRIACRKRLAHLCVLFSAHFLLRFRRAFISVRREAADNFTGYLPHGQIGFSLLPCSFARAFISWRFDTPAGAARVVERGTH